MLGDAKSGEKETLSRSKKLGGLKRPIEKVIFALLTRTIDLFIDEGPIELHVPDVAARCSEAETVPT